MRLAKDEGRPSRYASSIKCKVVESKALPSGCDVASNEGQVDGH